jgi:hypothetical protein
MGYHEEITPAACLAGLPRPATSTKSKYSYRRLSNEFHAASQKKGGASIIGKPPPKFYIATFIVA